MMLEPSILSITMLQATTGATDSHSEGRLRSQSNGEH